MVNFAAGELALPIRKIIWAPSNAAHHDHLHVEGPHVSGTLQQCTSKWTEAITTIRGALDGKFGVGDHYQVWDDTLGWTHMGVYNCRYIANTTTPSQHAFSNAIDIGPYYGVAEQQKFYDFLTRKEGEEDDMTPAQEQALNWLVEARASTADPSWGATQWNEFLKIWSSGAFAERPVQFIQLAHTYFRLHQRIKKLEDKAPGSAELEAVIAEIVKRLSK